MERPAKRHSPPSGRIVAYDALRVFAILTVVAIHTLMPYRSVLDEDATVRVLDDVLHYAVPLFVFISGVLVWGRPWIGEPGAYRRFLYRRFSAIGLPYLAWATLYAAVFVAQSADVTASLARLPGLLLTGHVWYHLYFIPMLLTFYLFTPLAARIAHRCPEALLAGTLLLRILFGAALIAAAKHVAPLFGSYVTHLVTHLPHMALGAWFAVRLPVIPGRMRAAWPLLLAAGLGGSWAVAAAGLPSWPLSAHRAILPVLTAATVLGFALAALAAEPYYARFARTVTHLGSLSFGVYFVHPLLLLGVDAAVAASGNAWPWGHWWFPVTVWIAVSAVSFGASDLLQRGAATAWLVGLRPRRAR